MNCCSSLDSFDSIGGNTGGGMAAVYALFRASGSFMDLDSSKWVSGAKLVKVRYDLHRIFYFGGERISAPDAGLVHTYTN